MAPAASVFGELIGATFAEERRSILTSLTAALRDVREQWPGPRLCCERLAVAGDGDAHFSECDDLRRSALRLANDRLARRSSRWDLKTAIFLVNTRPAPKQFMG
jgi:hypothetical protein